MVEKSLLLLGFFLFSSTMSSIQAQDYDEPNNLSKAEDDCNGIFLSYVFLSRVKEFPHLKNVSAQSYAFKSRATILNAGSIDLKAWKIFIGFQYNEILVSVNGAILSDGTNLPAHVINGTYFSGFPVSDLKTSIETAGDIDQISVGIDIIGTQFGVKSPAYPMPSTIRLANDGYKCPAATLHGNEMHVCCRRNPKLKSNSTLSSKFLPRQNGDLNIAYDVISAYEGNYIAQVTMENINPLGRLDHWNLTWEWKRGEFIYSMKGAYTHRKDSSDCLYGPAANYYRSLDFSQIMDCEKNPIISDLPQDRAKDNSVGNINFCCKNGSLLPSTMDPSQSKAVFQLLVYKIPPDMNRTILYPPQNWKINGVLNPDYKCGPPIRVSPTEFPDSNGLELSTSAIASWQVVCNITRPEKKKSRCCVSFSAFYNDSVIPCNTCACECSASDTCDKNSPPLLLPSEALLLPFENRTLKAKAWARLKHIPIPNPMPCGDNCGVSINWHIFSDYKDGWTARITLFNWENINFADWFTAVEMKKAYIGYENVYSFNGSKIQGLNDTLFFQGLPGLNYLMSERDGLNPMKDPRIPGKQQSVISFKKKLTPGIDILAGDGFPSRVLFNGEECALPPQFPSSRSEEHGSKITMISVVLLLTVSFIMLMG